jgi:hypothetical protein
VWVWGLEIANSICSAEGKDSALALRGDGDRAINNVIHNGSACNGVGGWKTGKNQVIYGNLVYSMSPKPKHPHGVYSQNDYSISGFKYIVGNMLLDANISGCRICFAVHAYGERNGATSGFHVEKNIMRNGRFIIGNSNQGPADNNMVFNNYTWGYGVELGFAQPSQAEVRGNYFAKARINFNYWWGAGDKKYATHNSSAFTDNTVYLKKEFYSLRFRTAAYPSFTAHDPIVKVPKLMAGDDVDRNTYYGEFFARLDANNVQNNVITLPNWRTVTTSAGKQFDANSTFTLGKPPQNKVFLVQNEYAPKTAFLVVYRWVTGNQNVPLDLDGIAPDGSTVQLLDPRNIWGAPILTTQVNGGRIIVPSPAEHNVFYVKFETVAQATLMDKVINVMAQILPDFNASSTKAMLGK